MVGIDGFLVYEENFVIFMMYYVFQIYGFGDIDFSFFVNNCGVIMN